MTFSSVPFQQTGRSEGRLDRPPSMQAFAKSFWINACPMCPLRQRESFILESQQTIAPSIVRLYFFYCPTNIASFVIAIVLNAIKTMVFIRTFPNILHNILCELYKRLTPIVRHFDAAPTIIRILRGFRVRTPLDKITPKSIQIIPISSMNQFTNFDLFRIQTSTRFRMLSSQSVSTNNHFFSTHTSTQPASAFFGITRVSDNSQSSIDIVRQVQKTRVSWFRDVWNVRILVDHIATPVSNLIRSMQVCACSTFYIVSNREVFA